jgi:hypothetical protein
MAPPHREFHSEELRTLSFGRRTFMHVRERRSTDAEVTTVRLIAFEVCFSRMLITFQP